MCLKGLKPSLGDQTPSSSFFFSFDRCSCAAKSLKYYVFNANIHHTIRNLYLNENGALTCATVSSPQYKTVSDILLHLYQRIAFHIHAPLKNMTFRRRTSNRTSALVGAIVRGQPITGAQDLAVANRIRGCILCLS